MPSVARRSSAVAKRRVASVRAVTVASTTLRRRVTSSGAASPVPTSTRRRAGV
jgi:hypothetical protein